MAVPRCFSTVRHGTPCIERNIEVANPTRLPPMIRTGTFCVASGNWKSGCVMLVPGCCRANRFDRSANTSFSLDPEQVFQKRDRACQKADEAFLIGLAAVLTRRNRNRLPESRRQMALTGKARLQRDFGN